MAGIRKRGETYTVFWRDPNGKQTSATFAEKGALGEGNVNAAQFCAEVTAQGNPVHPRGWRRVGRTMVRVEADYEGGEIPFVDYARKVIDAKPTLSAQARKDAHAVLDNHVAPYFGRTAIADIDWLQLSEFQQSLSAKLSANSVITYRGLVLTPVFEAAWRDNMIPANPMNRVDAPKRRRTPVNILTPEQFALFREAALEVDASIAAAGVDKDPAFFDALTVLAATGMRVSELLNLRVGDFTPATGNEPARIIGGLKTEAGTDRTIIVDPECADILAWRTRQAMASGLKYLFPAARGGRMAVTVFEARFAKCLDIATKKGLTLRARPDKTSGIKSAALTPHMLRHASVTTMMDAGVSPKRVAAHHGHNNVQTSLGIYTHVTKNRAADEGVIAAMEAYRLPVKKLRAV